MAATRLQALDRRYLDILEVGGPRKPNVLCALAPSASAFRSSIARLKSAGMVEHQKRGAGGLIALKGSRGH